MNKISYTALYLNEKSRSKLKKLTISILNKLNIKHKNSEIYRFAHHMTICMGELQKSKFKSDIKVGDSFDLIVDSYGYDEKLGVLAFKVKTKAPSINNTKHITVYVRSGSKPYLSNKIARWDKVNDFNIRGVVSQFEAGNNTPLPYKNNSLLESVLFGDDLSIVKMSLLVLWDIKHKKMICYGYDLMEMLKEAGYIARNVKIINIHSLQKGLDKLMLKIYSVDNSFLNKIKRDDFSINKNIVNKVIKNTILMEGDFSNHFSNPSEILEKSDHNRRSILTGDYNVSGNGTDKDKLSITKLEEELIRRGVDNKTAITVAKDMYKNGVKAGLRTAFSKGYIPNVYKIETYIDDNTIEGDYYINNFLFATYISEF